MNPPENSLDPSSPIAKRFRGYLPVIIDVETGGFNSHTDALLEIAAVTLRMDENGNLNRHQTFSFHLIPFEGANIEKAALDFTGIDLDCPDRIAEPELMVLSDMFQEIRREVKLNGCTRALLVGHNAHFDLNFLNAAIGRSDIKRSPFHPFSVFDTATLAGLAYGQTVLAKACRCAGLEFNNSAAHSAAYDAEKTAELFCTIVNKWKEFGGWPIEVINEENEPEEENP